MKNIEALIDDGGDITIRAIYPTKCAAIAADGHNSVALLVRQEGETLNALLKRLDKAIGKFYDAGMRSTRSTATEVIGVAVKVA